MHILSFHKAPCAPRTAHPHRHVKLSWGRCRHFDVRPPSTCTLATAGDAAVTSAEERMIAEVESLGFPSGILPGAQGKEDMMALVSVLEAQSPVPDPLTCSSGPSPLLFGSWRLVYASNGTVVTRTKLAQALVAASQLPGVGLRDVQQDLVNAQGDIKTTNSALFGLGPLGEWDATIYGTWRVESGSLAKVAFEGYSVQLIGFFGWRPLQEAFKLKIPLPESARQRAAEFQTTYLSPRLRIARGSTGNVFVFVRKPEA